MPSNSQHPSEVFRSVTAPKNLKETYKEYVRNRPARGRDGIEPIALQEDISAVCELISRKTRAGTYKFTSYRQLLLTKGAFQPPRVISIPTARDRIVLKSLAFLIESVFPNSRGKVPQKKVSKLQRTLKKNKFDGFLRLDIKDFYPSISHKEIKKTLRKKIRKKEILSLIEDSIYTPTLSDRAPKSDVSETQGVPQGLPISNLLAEIAMEEVDRQFENNAEIFYLRYVDDIVILCNLAEAEDIYADVKKACEDISLDVYDPKCGGSKSKIGSTSESFDYLGYVFSPTKITVRPESISNLKASMARVFTHYKYAVTASKDDTEAVENAKVKCLWKLNLVITGCIFYGQRKGWIHYFSQIDDVSTLKRLDATVQKFARRFGLEEDFQPKTFTRAFWRITQNDTSSEPYIPNFDQYSSAQRRQVLTNIFHHKNTEQLNDEETKRTLDKEIKPLLKSMDADISSLS